MKYDPKNKTLSAYPKNGKKPMKGLFVLEIEDNFGNKTKTSKTL